MQKKQQSQPFLSNQQEVPFYCRVVRKHFFRDRVYQLKYYNNQITMTYVIDINILQHLNMDAPKYLMKIEEFTTFEWLIKQQRLFGFKFPYQGKLKEFHADQTDLMQLRQRLSNRMVFLNLSYNYKYLTTLESGSFGQVTSNECFFNNKKVAIKHILLNGKKDHQKQIENEIQILRSIKHPKLVEIYEVFKTELYYQIVTEFIEGLNLKQLMSNKLNQFKNEEILEIMQQLFEALTFLHRNQILHRDIKPANIMYHNGKLKLIDFGLACYDGKQLLENPNCGTEGYVAPEVLNVHQTKLNYDFKVDVYGAGCVLYMLLTGTKLNQSNLSFQKNKTYQNSENSQLFELVKIMTKPNPFDRPSSFQILELIRLIKENCAYDISLWYSSAFNLSNSNNSYQTASTARYVHTSKNQKSVCSFNSARGIGQTLSKQILK
ncbi:unnamed protein product (macronuclear) [Paramecium tetraurelia]|uniref:Protein kinase domain-containing protein n=1 Tax=Paramecium tetraurelia TaxID=5888 RepID=A0CSX5_PARTE|nr:uncharacterized protein GSPATT00010165001 [Paramecium tetraurelia]CAK73892.1 unnamed protein product [Paramecium tetraurelia]|eukprot:XP_001441289.1 hypothetical protein (macronuclear) [Paramecium tetraurelia strain d4-2]